MNTKIGLLLGSVLVAGCGGELDDATDLEQTQSAVMWGSTDFTNFPNEQLRTVRVGLPGAACSGTLMRTRVVLTAAHCVTSNLRPDGPLRPLTDFTVKGLKPTEIVRPSQGNVDAALLFFGADLTTQWEDFTAIDPGAINRYAGRTMMFTGYGYDENGASGTLRNGSLTVYAGNVSYYVSSIDWTGISVPGSNPQGGTVGGSGDSGGPLWGPGSWPNAVYGVESASDGVRYGTTNFAQAHDFRHQFRQAIYSRINPNMGVSFDTQYQFDVGFGTIQGRTGTACNWAVQGGALVQLANAPECFVIQTRNRSFENVYVTTYLQSSDDDTLGIVFRYVDKNNHYRCEANRAGRSVRIIKRRNGGDTVLSTTLWNGTFDGGAMQAGATENSFYCTYRDTVVTAQDSTYLIGKVGLFNHFNSNGKFLSFQSTQTPPVSGDW